MTENFNPLVSVCIPVYNGAEFLRYTLDCCVNQTYKNIEIIICDNASTDNTVEIIKSYNDSRIKLFQNPNNIGLLPNFEKVLSLANGYLMGFLGADDWMDVRTIEKSVNVFNQKGNEDLVLTNTFIKIINNFNETIYTKKFLFGKGGKLSTYWTIRSNFLYGSNIIGEPNGSFFKRDAYLKITNPKFKNANKWTVDLDLKFELALQGPTYMIKESLGGFRVSNQSTSKNELRFSQAKLFREYAYKIYKDKRYNLSFFWVITASINSIIMQIARNMFYVLFIKK